MEKYDHKKIEAKWRARWEESDIYKTQGGQRKCYVLDMFPYPSGEGLHVGHPKGYIATDIYSRTKHMQGYTILHPMGWDAFGLPAENYAIKNKVHPRVAVEKNIARFKEQLGMLGLNYDWDREVNTTDPAYYKWTQWIFLKLLEKGLAYESYEPINWCPSCQTGLANEDLENGHCERCGSVVEKKPMRQWVLKITDYAERLLHDLDTLEWPESIKESQRNWIGKSEGALISFPINTATSAGVSGEHTLEVFTTRPDTLFGATFIAISPELAHKWLDAGWQPHDEVKKYIEETLAQRATQTYKDNPEKTGVFSGVFATNPANKEDIPVWVTNYVLGDVGTGAIMAVPAHDERDYEFAKKYNLPIKQVIAPHHIDESNPPQKGKKNAPRIVVQGIVRHWKDDTVIQIVWKQLPWKTFVIGGAEEGENLEDAIKREVLEETGYKNIKSIRKLAFEMRSEWFATHKNENRYAHMHMFEIILANGEREELSDEEKAKHDVVWVPFSSIPSVYHPVSELSEIWNALNSHSTYPQCFIGAGIVINSGEFSEMPSEEAKKKITEFVGGKMTITYRLKDWVFSRQRYWGEPIPVIHCEKCGVVPVPESELPVTLPEVEHYEPTGTGESPLATISEWVNTTCPQCGGSAKRETNTMPQWAGSSWYYLRYMDPHNDDALVAQENEKEWAPVDMYVGGTEHATRHLIYARFWHKFLYDSGVVSTEEPFMRLKNQGLIMGEDGRKMSKRFGNVVNPDEIVGRFGADTLRVYEMFMGPFEDGIAWSTDNMVGSRRFLEKVWRIAEKVGTHSSPDAERALHQTIQKVTEDIESFKFNTAISQMMIAAGIFEKEELSKKDFLSFLLLLSPFAPHISQELWELLGETGFIYNASWPAYIEDKTKVAHVMIAIQVNGKIRDEFLVNPELSEAEIVDQALKREKIILWINGQDIKKTLYVKGRLVSIVV